MAFLPHIRVTALGRIGTSGEKFSYGFNLGNTDGAVTFVKSAGVQDLWEDMAADIRNFHVSANSYIESRAVLEAVKFARITAEGEYERDSNGALDTVTVDVVDAPGNFSEPLVLPQAALAISLTTGRYGPSGKGRFYMPMPVLTTAGDGRISSTTAETVRGSAQTLLNALNDQPGVDELPQLQVIVASTKGFNTPVTGVRVGRVVDTVRSRRRSIEENYTTVAEVTN